MATFAEKQILRNQTILMTALSLLLEEAPVDTQLKKAAITELKIQTKESQFFIHGGLR